MSEPYDRDVEPEWGADIGIVARCDIEGTLYHEWGYLLQAKKASLAGDRPSRWDINRDQLEDLLLRTNSGFYLLYTPREDEDAPYVVPARTIHSILDAAKRARRSGKGQEAQSIPYSAGVALGKPFTAFLLEDVLGSWSGEPDPKLVERVREGVAARVVLEVDIAIGRQVG